MKITHANGYAPNFFVVNRSDNVQFKATTDSPGHGHGITIRAYNISLQVNSTSTLAPDEIVFEAKTRGTFTITCGTCNSQHFANGGRAFTGTLQVN